MTNRERFRNIRSDIKEIEKKQRDLSELHSGRIEEYISIGFSEYTYERRSLLIQKAKDKGFPSYYINDLTRCHEKWELEQIEFSDVNLFENCEAQLFPTDDTKMKEHENVLKLLIRGLEKSWEEDGKQ